MDLEGTCMEPTHKEPGEQVPYWNIPVKFSNDFKKIEYKKNFFEQIIYF